MTRLTLVSIVLVFLAVPVSSVCAQTAQTSQAGSSPAPQTLSQPGQPAPDKKVWTNEDITDLRARSVISVSGSSKPGNAGQKPDPPSRARDTNWYRNEILKLQAKLPPLDDKIDQLQAALDGKTVDSVRTYGATRADDWRDQLARLRKQRGEISTKIAALQDEARHNGVPTNALP